MSRDTFLAACEVWRKSPSAYGFSVIVLGGQVLLRCERDLAVRFEVAESTVDRWGRGTARPHPRLMEQIVEELETRVRAL